MPEGPEIRLAADQVAAAIQDKKTSRVFFAFDHLKPYERMLTGRTVTAVDTRGKAMLIRFGAADEGDRLTVYSYNQLYGKWMIAQNRKMVGTIVSMSSIGTDRAAFVAERPSSRRRWAAGGSTNARSARHCQMSDCAAVG